MGESAGLKHSLERLYNGRSRRASLFRYGLIGFDLFTIGFFLATTPVAPTAGIYAMDYAIGVVILADFLARLWIAPKKLRMLRQVHTIADLLVVLTEWNEFRALDLSRIAGSMRGKRMADLRNVYTLEDAKAAGFTEYDSIGRVGTGG